MGGSLLAARLCFVKDRFKFKAFELLVNLNDYFWECYALFKLQRYCYGSL